MHSKRMRTTRLVVATRCQYRGYLPPECLHSEGRWMGNNPGVTSIVVGCVGSGMSLGALTRNRKDHCTLLSQAALTIPQCSEMNARAVTIPLSRTLLSQGFKEVRPPRILTIPLSCTLVSQVVRIVKWTSVFWIHLVSFALLLHLLREPRGFDYTSYCTFLLEVFRVVIWISGFQPYLLRGIALLLRAVRVPQGLDQISQALY